MGFNVIPSKLRTNQKAFAEAATGWKNLKTAAGKWKLDDTDLGVLGVQSGVVADYNRLIDHVVGELAKGETRLAAAGTALDKCAKAYEAKDERYYRRFGYTSEDLKRGAPQSK